MEPVTHAVASVVLGRAGLDRITRLTAPMLLVSGMAADIDWSSYGGGASVFLAWRRTATHSLLGAAAIAAMVAAGFWMWDRRRGAQRIAYLRALGVCACGAGMHLLLDLTNDSGVMLLWPFGERRFAWDVAPEVDPVLLVIVLAGLLLPALLNLVGEEIAGRRQKRRGSSGALIALLAGAAYLGARAVGHQSAITRLDSHVYGQEAPRRIAAFPGVSPALWHGVVETETAVHEADIALLRPAEFDAAAARTLFKPGNSAVLQRAAASDPAQEFLSWARFPLASVEPRMAGWEVRIRDLRQAAGSALSPEIVAVVELNAGMGVTRSTLEFTGGEGE